MLNQIRRRLADRLRSVASLLDGRQFVDARWNRLNVNSMNSYIGQTERYILELEELIVDFAPADESQADNIVEDLRQKHGRFDTKRFLDAGAWPEVPEPPPYRRGEA